MRIACVDISAGDRLKLEQFLDDSFRDCRKSVGHMLVARFYPSTKDEILVNSSPDIIVIGPAFSSDESLTLARDICSVHPSVPVFVFLAENEFSLRNIKRFEPYVSEVFSVSDPASRFVYALTSVSESSSVKKNGSLFTIQGVKGGVGATTITGALAHAAQALGKSVALIDLSAKGELCQYFLCDQWQSSEYTSLLTDKVLPEPEHLQKILITAKNGISILPPPAGFGEVREFWLRDATRFEISLSLIDLLQERFDIVFVDFSHAEGILPFALECRADVRLFISANEAGSVHLLTNTVNEFSSVNDSVHNGITKFLINSTSPKGLTNEDILDFISWNPKFNDEMLYPEEVPFDSKGSLWIGTGNSFYTEGSSKSRLFFDELIRDALGLDEGKSKTFKIPFARALKAISDKTTRKKIEFQKKERIPFFAEEKNSLTNKLIDGDVSNKSIQSVNEKIIKDENLNVLYEPPKLRVNQ